MTEYEEEPTQRIPLLADQPVDEELDPTDPGPYILEREAGSGSKPAANAEQPAEDGTGEREAREDEP